MGVSVWVLVLGFSALTADRAVLCWKLRGGFCVCGSHGEGNCGAAHAFGVLNQHQRQVIDLSPLQAGDIASRRRARPASRPFDEDRRRQQVALFEQFEISSISGFDFEQRQRVELVEQVIDDPDAVGGRDDGEGLVLLGEGDAGGRRRRQTRRRRDGLDLDFRRQFADDAGEMVKVAKVEASPSTRKTRSRLRRAVRRSARRRGSRPWRGSRRRASSGKTSSTVSPAWQCRRARRWRQRRKTLRLLHRVKPAGAGLQRRPGAAGDQLRVPGRARRRSACRSVLFSQLRSLPFALFHSRPSPPQWPCAAIRCMSRMGWLGWLACSWTTSSRRRGLQRVAVARFSMVTKFITSRPPGLSRPRISRISSRVRRPSCR